jgi:hypothetical protein
LENVYRLLQLLACGRHRGREDLLLPRRPQPGLEEHGPGKSLSFKERVEDLKKFEIMVPYFIEYIAHFFTLKMMLEYSLCTMHGK